jgi:hypothetical protein
MTSPWVDQDRAAAREAGAQTACYWRALRAGGVPRWLAARLTLAWLGAGETVVTVVADEG